MSESHGTALKLKHHEDFEKVAAYVKLQVREKSLELIGKDLSADSEFVGLQIDADKDSIIWHDYGHHGDHLDFDPIAESVIKEFPEVEMECQGWWGHERRIYPESLTSIVRAYVESRRRIYSAKTKLMRGEKTCCATF